VAEVWIGLHRIAFGRAFVGGSKHVFFVDLCGVRPARETKDKRGAIIISSYSSEVSSCSTPAESRDATLHSRRRNCGCSAAGVNIPNLNARDLSTLSGCNHARLETHSKRRDVIAVRGVVTLSITADIVDDGCGSRVIYDRVSIAPAAILLKYADGARKNNHMQGLALTEHYLWNHDLGSHRHAP
jgi:hypothetical protein